MYANFTALWTAWERDEFSRMARAGWDLYEAKPGSYRARYCEILAQKSSKGFTLEALSRMLIRSVEALAWESMELGGGPLDDAWTYIPVIVTNAELFACFLDPAEVDLRSGAYKKSDFAPIPFIRFHKSLVTELHPDRRDIGQRYPLAIKGRSRVRSIRDSHGFRERTVFVVTLARAGELTT
jgi:hypothetical protein